MLCLIVKPTQACNLNCSYCYEYEVRQTNKKAWDDNVVRRIGKLCNNSHDDIRIIWHGGEAALMGAEWFENATRILKEEAPNTNFDFSIQSNGILLTEEFCKKMDELKIGIGVSYDGTEQCQRCGQKTEETIVKNISKYNEDGKKVGCISVVGPDFAARFDENIDKMKDMGLNSVCFNEIFSVSQLKQDFFEEKKEYMENWKVLVRKLLLEEKCFRERTTRDIFSIAINHTDETTCTYGDCRYGFLSIDSNGFIFPCDSAYNYNMGHIELIENFFEVFASKKYRDYSMKVENQIKKCRDKECPLVDYCKGGCPTRTYLSDNCSEEEQQFACDFLLELYELCSEIVEEHYSGKTSISNIAFLDIIEKKLKKQDEFRKEETYE